MPERERKRTWGFVGAAAHSGPEGMCNPQICRTMWASSPTMKNRGWYGRVGFDFQGRIKKKANGRMQRFPLRADGARNVGNRSAVLHLR